MRRPAGCWLGAAKLAMDILVGTAVLAGVAFVLWRWNANLFAGDWFWGDEGSDFGQYINVVKTAAFFGLFLPLLALGQNESVKSVYFSYFGFNYSKAFDEEEFHRKDPKNRSARIFVILIGAAVMAYFITIFLLPLAFSAQLLPQSWTLESKFPEIRFVRRQSVGVGNPVTSTIEKNRFGARLDANEDYLVIIETVDEVDGGYAFYFDLREIRRRDIVFNNDEDASYRWRSSWQILSVPRSSTVDFEVDYTGRGDPGSYRVHLLKISSAYEGIDTISPSNSGDYIETVNFQGEAGQGYLLIASTDDSEPIRIHIYRDGQERVSTRIGSGREFVIVRSDIIERYSIDVRGIGFTPLDSYRLVITPIPD